MKNIKSITFIAALIVGISYCPLEVMALSRYNEKQPEQQEYDRKESVSSENLERVCLQIPEKLEITIDPLEINGNGQIYSNQYIIKNSGSTAGTLILSDLVCEPQKNSGAIVKTNNIGIHDNREKSVYVEAVFGNGDKVILSQPDAKYEVRLDSSEELLLTFSGEVNENAIRKWEDNDVIVSMVYSWNIDKSVSDESDQQGLDDFVNELEEEKPEEFNTKLDSEKWNDRIDEMEKVASDSVIEEPDKKEFKESISKNEETISPVLIEAEFIKNEVMDSQKRLENVSDKKSEDKQLRENQDLQIPGKMEIIVDPLEVTGKGQVYSGQYIIRNSGDAVGKLSLFDFKCNIQEDSGISVKADKTGIHNNEEKSIYIEAILGNSNKVILSQPDAKYEAELKSGEELILAFSGEVNEKAVEKWKADEIKVSIDYRWDMDVEESIPTPNIEFE